MTGISATARSFPYLRAARRWRQGRLRRGRLCSLCAPLQGSHVENRLPSIVFRHLRGIRRHVLLSVCEDVKHPAVFQCQCLLTSERRWRREAAHGDGPVTSSGPPVAGHAPGAEHECTTRECRKILEGIGIAQLFARTDRTGLRGLVIHGMKTARNSGRPQTEARLDGLDTIPRAKREYRGASFEEMDLDAVLARRPEVALVDEFAHTNVPGSRNEKRWQDVEELLDAGIEVISAVNIQHLESLNDVVEKITGVPQRETVPDAIVRAADQVEMVDMTAEALRRRMAHGNIYPPEKIDAALTNYFRSGNLSALRELALLWLADKVDEGLQRYRAEHQIKGAWEARERVVVALTGGPEGRTLIRRAARIAARSAGGDLLA